MEWFVLDQNVRRFERLCALAGDPAENARLESLLREVRQTRIALWAATLRLANEHACQDDAPINDHRQLSEVPQRLNGSTDHPPPAHTIIVEPHDGGWRVRCDQAPDLAHFRSAAEAEAFAKILGKKWESTDEPTEIRLHRGE
jgi:hypothetical protein